MKVKIIVLLLILVLAITVIHNRELIQYGWWQGKGQLAILWNAQPIESLLDNLDIADSLKQKLRLLENIKSYGQSIGLSVNESYNTVYDQKGQPILWNVSACLPYSFESYQWHFPFLGSLAYKGFFELEKAKNLVKELEDQGWDVNIRTVGAWSTLGWFDDPLMSNQLFRSEGALAETVLHELTHATLFYPDSLDFNENLASFIGKEAAIRFITIQYGEQSQQLRQFLSEETDAAYFRTHMLRGKQALDSLYESFPPDLSEQNKEILKTSKIQEIIDNLDTLDFRDERYNSIFEVGSLPNNAYFMGFNRYYSKQDSFKKTLDSLNGDLKAWIHEHKNHMN